MRLTNVLVAASLVLFASHAAAGPLVSQLRSDEEIVFYPTLAWPAMNGTGWDVQISGGVFEREQLRLTLTALRAMLGLDGIHMNPAELAVFKQRARLFFADNERGHRVVARIGDQTFDLGKSSPNGHFTAQLHLTNTPAPAFWKISAVLKQGDTRQFNGMALPIRATGLSVISDVDDTIKISEVLNQQALVRRTFLQPFEAVPGMADVYRAWATNGAQFHYVSASPWQLYLPLAEFGRTNSFPNGSWHMKSWRLKDRSFAALFGDPQKYKLATIAPLLRQFPKRRFILVGDSGERDPEAYAALAREFPAQVAAIFIRDVSGEPAGAERYRTNFAGLPGGLWRVFKEPAEIAPLLP